MHAHLEGMDKPVSSLLDDIRKLQASNSKHPAGLVCLFLSANPTEPFAIRSIGYGSTVLQIILLQKALTDIRRFYPVEAARAEEFAVVELSREEVQT